MTARHGSEFPTAAVGGDYPRKWNQFSMTIVAVLVFSVLAVLVVTAGVSKVQMEGLVRQEQERRASDLASFMARRAVVPVILEDKVALQRIVDVSFISPDVVAVQISDARGQPVLSRTALVLGPRAQVTASIPIEVPHEGRRTEVPEVVGRVTVTLSLERVYGTVTRAFNSIVTTGLGVLTAAVAIAVALIIGMTRRLRGLVGEAKLAEALRRSNEELEQFAFVASHDLQEPLRKIVSYCQLLEKVNQGKLDAQSAGFMGIIVQGSRRMSAMIEDLLSFSRISAHARPFEPVDVGALLGELLGMMEGSITAAGGVVTYDPMPKATADAGQLSRVFQNLIGNALKFRGERPPRVHVAVRREGADWEFCVQDNGIGIDPKDADRIFDMFKRLHPRDKYPGTGIGLAVCKKIIERHGGRIWVKPAAGGGAAFCFTLPIIAPPSTGPRQT